MRVAVFIDWENVARAAKRAFGVRRDATFSPLALASLLAAKRRGGEERQVVVVEIHRGLPSPRRDPVGHTSARKLSLKWKREAEGVVVPRLRPLRYRKHPDGIIRGEEKGIDVQLAASAVRWVLKDECDVAVIFSHDSDMSPAVEMLAEVEGSECIETASWLSPGHRHRIPNHGEVWNHCLTEQDFHFAASASRHQTKARSAAN